MHNILLNKFFSLKENVNLKSTNLESDKVHSLSLEECIRMYDREDSRKNSLESKASTLLSASALLISVLSFFITFSTILINFKTYSWLYGTLDMLVIFFVGACMVFLLKSIKIKNYHVPLA